MSEQTDDPIELLAFLAQHDNGYANTKGTRDLAAVTKAVREHGRTGQVAVTIDIKRMGDDEDSPLLIAVNVTPKPPLPKRAAKTWHTDDKGGLHKFPPRQRALFDDVQIHDPREGTKTE